MGHFLLFPAPHGGGFVAFCALLKLIPTYILGWGGRGVGVYFDWCITIIISCFWHFPTQFVQDCRPTLGLPYKKAVDAYQKVELNPLESQSVQVALKFSREFNFADFSSFPGTNFREFGFQNLLAGIIFADFMYVT